MIQYLYSRVFGELMETVAEKNGQHEPEKKIDPYTEDLLARKAKKEELRRKRLKRASFFWFTVFMYFGLIFVFALFMFKATGILDMLQNLNNKAQQVASRERPARGVVRRSIRTKTPITFGDALISCSPARSLRLATSCPTRKLIRSTAMI
jgi:hypothetical protein